MRSYLTLLLLSFSFSSSFASDPDKEAFLRIFVLPKKETIEPSALDDIRRDVDQLVDYFQKKFTDPKYKVLLERQIPFYLAFEKIFAAHYLYSESFAEFEIARILIDALLSYFKELGPLSEELSNKLNEAVKKKCELFNSPPFFLPGKFKAFSELLDDPRVAGKKQTIIDGIHVDFYGRDSKWDVAVLEGLEKTLKDRIIEQKNEIVTKCNERYLRLTNYCTDLFKDLKKYPQVQALGSGSFKNFSKELADSLLFRYIYHTNSLFKICSSLPHLKIPMNVLENNPLVSKFLTSLIKKVYDPKIIPDSLKDKLDTREMIQLISEAEAIMLKDFGFPVPEQSASEELRQSQVVSDLHGTVSKGTEKLVSDMDSNLNDLMETNSRDSTSGEKGTDPSKGSSSGKPGTGGSGPSSGMEMGKILGITFMVVAVVIAACVGMYFIRRSKSA